MLEMNMWNSRSTYAQGEPEQRSSGQIHERTEGYEASNATEISKLMS